MSLEAIAALLAHRSPRMTLVYARIADTVVAEQYFSATRAVEAETLAVEPPNDDRDTTARHHRLLGKGRCSRPLDPRALPAGPTGGPMRNGGAADLITVRQVPGTAARESNL
jgi:hypothetical protein